MTHANAAAEAIGRRQGMLRAGRWSAVLSPATRGGIAAGSWLLAGQAAAAGAQFGFSIIRARSLTLEEFGAWSFAAALVSLAGVTADFGLGVVAAREMSQRAESTREYLRTVAALGILLALTANLLVVAAVLLVRPGGAAALVAMTYGAQLLIGGYAVAPVSYFRAHQDTAWECAGRVLQATVTIGGAAAVAWLGGGLAGFAAAALVATMLFPVPLLFAARRGAGIPIPRLNIGSSYRILGSAWPIGIGIAATSVYYYADTVIMGVLGQRRAVALYGADYTLLFGVILMVSAMHAAFLPILSRAAGISTTEFRAAARSFLRLSGVAAACVMVAGPLVAGATLALVFGDSFADGTTALRLLMVTGGVMFLSSGFGTTVLAARQERRYMRVVLAGAVINVALNLLLIPPYSLNGAAAATLAAEVTVCLLMAAAFASVLTASGDSPLREEPR